MEGPLLMLQPGLLRTSQSASSYWAASTGQVPAGHCPTFEVNKAEKAYNLVLLKLSKCACTSPGGLVKSTNSVPIDLG